MKTIIDRVRNAETIYIPKSQKEEPFAREWLQEVCDIDVPEFKGRCLTAESLGVLFSRMRSADSLPIVERSRMESISFIGSIRYKEYLLQQLGWVSQLRLFQIKQEMCRLAIGIPLGVDLDLNRAEPIRVATSYPFVTQLFANQKGYNFGMVRPTPQGCVEGFVRIGEADIVTDLVDSGDTLKEQGLVEGEFISFDYLGLVWKSDFMPPFNQNASDLQNELQ